MNRLAFVVVFALASSSCGGSKPQPQHTSVPEGATDPQAPIPTGTAEVHLTCVGQNPTACQTPDFELDVVASALDGCSIKNGEISLAIDLANDPDEGLSLHVSGYGGPGTYPLGGNAANNRVSVTGTIVNPRHTHQPASPQEPCPAPGVSTAPAESIQSCSGCQVAVSDDKPSDAFPKLIGFDITCPKLCVSDSQICTATNRGDIRMNVRVQCTN